VSIKLKFTLFISILIILIIVGSTTFLYYAEKKLLINQLEDYQKTLITGLAQIARESLLVGDDLILLNYSNLLKKTNQSIVSVFVVGKKNKIIAHTDATQLGKKYDAVLNVDGLTDDKQNSLTSVKQKVYFGEEPVAECVIGFSKDELKKIYEQGLAQTRRRIFTVGIVAVIIGLVGSLVFAHFMTEPIKILSQSAEVVGSGDLNHKVKILRRDELGSLANHFNVMIEKLKELDEMKKDFVSAVTHELRSPLAAIETYVNLLLSKNPDYETENFLRIKKNVARLRNFINDLLDTAKIEKGKMEIIRMPFDLSMAARDVVDLFKPLAEEKKITLSYEGLETARVNADEDRIKQVITNLVSNALKFTPEGGKISIRLTRPDGKSEFIVSVSDTGIGIPPEYHDKIFAKFEQVKGVRRIVKGPKGTGLGLSIAKGIVELHNGRIWLESELNKGTTFYFTLPSG